MCDQGSSNRSVVNMLGVTVDKPTFEHNDSTIFVVYEPPHLLKHIRNNLKRSVFCANEERISWKYVEQFYQIDSSLLIRNGSETCQSASICLYDSVSSNSISTQPFCSCMTGD